MSYLSFSSIISLIGLLFVPIGYWHKPFLSTAWLLCGIFAVCAVIFDVAVQKNCTVAFIHASIAAMSFGYAFQSFFPQSYSVLYGWGGSMLLMVCAFVSVVTAASKGT